jgi:hypothetical protein
MFIENHILNLAAVLPPSANYRSQNSLSVFKTINISFLRNEIPDSPGMNVLLSRFPETTSPARLTQIFRPLGNRAAVNDHHFAIHEAIAIAHHKGRILREFFRTTEPTGRCPEVVHL